MDGSPIHVSIAGRMMFKRVMGKASFCNIQDLKGNIQVYVARDQIGEESYADFKKSDIGDIYGVKGYAFRTKTGEISIHAEEMTPVSYTHLDVYKRQAISWHSCSGDFCVCDDSCVCPSGGAATPVLDLEKDIFKEMCIRDRYRPTSEPDSCFRLVHAGMPEFCSRLSPCCKVRSSDRSLHGSEAVSYTHLDVYKRQR